MNYNEPNPALRTILARLLTPLGAPLPANHVFAAGDFKIIQPNGTIANVSALPVPRANDIQGGYFDIQVAQAELLQLGNVMWQSNNALTIAPWAWQESVKYPGAGLLDCIIEGPLQYDGNGEPQPIGDPTNYNVSVAALLREIAAYTSNAAQNLDGLQGNPMWLSRVGGRIRTAGVLANGQRAITSHNDE